MLFRLVIKTNSTTLMMVTLIQHQKGQDNTKFHLLMVNYISFPSEETPFIPLKATWI